MKLVLGARYWRGLLAVLAVAAYLGLAVAAPATSASPSTNKPTCNLVSPALIKKVLGFSVQPPQVTVSGNELTCRYEIPKLYQSVAVHFTSGMTRQSFEYFRDAYSKGTKDYDREGARAGGLGERRIALRGDGEHARRP